VGGACGPKGGKEKCVRLLVGRPEEVATKKTKT
jgi:hypothetical protein